MRIAKGLILLALALGIACNAAADPLLEATGLWAVDGDTFVVELAGERVEIRLMGVDALETGGCLGHEAFERAQDLVTRTLWLELDPERGLERRDRNGRVLAHVFLVPEQTPSALLSARLVELGLARMDFPDVRDTWAPDHFDIKYAPWLIAAQIEAALHRRGWWGECDRFSGADLAIAAVKHWGDDEVVYIVNRGEAPIDLARGWRLTSDPPRTQTLDFGRYTRELLLPPGWVLRVHTGPVATGRKAEICVGEGTIDWYWTGRRVWRNGGDEARLLEGDEVVHLYIYPPVFGGEAKE